MKINRRGLFGIVAGGAVAGPQIAQGIVSEMARTAPSLGGSAVKSVVGYGLNQTAADMTMGDWRLERVAQLKRVLSGENKDDERERKRRVINYLEKVEAARLESLKSVSVGRKMVMLAESEASRMERYQAMDAEWELADLEEQIFKFPWT